MSSQNTFSTCVTSFEKHGSVKIFWNNSHSSGYVLQIVTNFCIIQSSPSLVVASDVKGQNPYNNKKYW